MSNQTMIILGFLSFIIAFIIAILIEFYIFRSGKNKKIKNGIKKFLESTGFSEQNEYHVFSVEWVESPTEKS